MLPLLKLFKEQLNGGIERATHFQGHKENNILDTCVGECNVQFWPHPISWPLYCSHTPGQILKELLLS